MNKRAQFVIKIKTLVQTTENFAKFVQFTF